MTTILGEGDYRYRVDMNWAKLPDGWAFMDVAAVAVDSKDQVYVFNRGEHPMIVFDRDGNFLRSWGEGVFNRAHGVHIASDDTLYCTDDGDPLPRIRAANPSTAAPTRRKRRTARCSSPTAMAIPVSTSTRRTGAC